MAKTTSKGEFKFEIEQHIAVIATTEKNWTKELNLVKWGEYPAKYDIREWNPDHTRMSKGLTFTEEELVELREILNEMEID